MADNISITEGSGKTVAFKDSSSVMHQRVIAESMTDAGAPQDTSASTPMPIKAGRAEAYEDEIEIAFGSIPSSFTDLSLSNVTTSTKLYIHNDTDKELNFRFAASGNTKFSVMPKTARLVPVLAGAAVVHYKYASAPTEGRVKIEVIK